MATELSTLLPLIHIPRCPEALRLQALRNACRRFCRDTEWWRAEVTADWLGANALQYLLVAGAGTTAINGYYVEDATQINGKASYTHSDGTYYISWDGERWNITDNDMGDFYPSSSDVDTPDLASGWTSDLGDEPTPTVTSPAEPLNWAYPNTQIIRVPWVKVDDREQPEYAWSVSNEGVLTFDPPLPAAADVIEAQIILMPTITATSVDDQLVNRFGEVIAKGAEFELKSDRGSELDPNQWFDPSGAALAREAYRDGVETAKLEVYSSMQSGDKQIDLMRGIW